VYGFEAHIVTYGRSNLSQVPEPFFLNQVDASTQGFSGIATAEVADIQKAYAHFKAGSEWSERQLTLQNGFGCHVKLEQLRHSTPVRKPDLKRLPVSSGRPRTFSSAIVSAWDVHLDGEFHPDFMRWLREERDYILLEYVSRAGKLCRTLTLHFLQQSTCQKEYTYIVPQVLECGGFVGTIYWEDPLAFVVYGPTTPRPVVI